MLTDTICFCCCCHQTLAAENVSLENQLLELKSSTLRLEKESRDASAAAARLEGQLAHLGSSAGQQGQELQGLQAERRILKARLMQVWGDGSSSRTCLQHLVLGFIAATVLPLEALVQCLHAPSAGVTGTWQVRHGHHTGCDPPV